SSRHLDILPARASRPKHSGVHQTGPTPNTPSQLAFAGGAAPAEGAPPSGRLLAPAAAKRVSFRIRIPSVEVRLSSDPTYVPTHAIAIRMGSTATLDSLALSPEGSARPLGRWGEAPPSALTLAWRRA